MKAKNLADIPRIEMLAANDPDADIAGAFTSDLLSDVIANAPTNSVLITVQAHRNTVAVASLGGIRAIVFCSGRTVPEDVLQTARENDINILRAECNQYEASWRIHAALQSV